MWRNNTENIECIFVNEKLAIFSTKSLNFKVRAQPSKEGSTGSRTASPGGCPPLPSPPQRPCSPLQPAGPGRKCRNLQGAEYSGVGGYRVVTQGDEEGVTQWSCPLSCEPN